MNSALIGHEKWNRYFNQSDAKTNRVFPTFQEVCLCVLESHWLLKIFPLL